ncbi:MAG TPA: YIP1 family protein [Terriglobales bacterium]|nr:YIP1 family protein [Terriglobales bacterium]
MSKLANRMVRAARLEPALYEEVEADRGGLNEAMAVVVLASVAAGVGTVNTLGIAGLISMTIGALVGWFVWAYLTYLIGTRLLPEPQTQADVGQLLRTTGFAAAPGVLRLLGFLPGVGSLIVLISSIWMLLAMVVAVKQALDYQGTGKALLVCLIGFVVQMLVLALIFVAFGAPAY